MGMFEHFPYTNFHDLNLDWLLKKVKEIEDSLKELWIEFLKSRVPTGGKKGQYLRKSEDKDYAMAWMDADGIMPTGGTENQVLTKNSAADYDASWKDVPKELPDGGTDGDILKHGPDESVYWGKEGQASNGLPVGGNPGQILKKTGTADFEAEWADESGGGSGDYLPLAGGTMDPGATIQLPEAGDGNTELSSGELHHTGNAFQFVGDFNFQTNCPSSQGVPTNPTDLTTKDYVDSKIKETDDKFDNVHSIPAGGTTGQVLKKSSDSDYDTEWADESGGGGGSGDYLPLAGGTMNNGATILFDDDSSPSLNTAIRTRGRLKALIHNMDGDNLDIPAHDAIEDYNGRINIYGARVNAQNPKNRYKRIIIDPQAGIRYVAKDLPTNDYEIPITDDLQLTTKKYVDDAAAGVANVKAWRFSPTNLNADAAGVYSIPGYSDFMPNSAYSYAIIEFVTSVVGATGTIPVANTIRVRTDLNVSNWPILFFDGGEVKVGGTISIARSSNTLTYTDAGNGARFYEPALKITKIGDSAITKKS